MLPRTNLAIVVLLCTAGPLFGQEREVKLEQVTLSGKLKDMGQGLLQIEANDGQTWLVKIEARDKDGVSYAGTATPDWIRPGMWVRFQSNLTFNRRYQADGPVTQLTVFTPTKDSEWGIVPDSQLGQGLFEDEPKPSEQVDKNTPVPCTVTGRIAGIKKNKMTVATGKASLTVEVTDDVRVAVEVADLSVAQPGDTVEIEGWKYEMVPGRAIANKVTVTGDKPLSGAKPKRGDKKKKDSEKAKPDREDRSEGNDEDSKDGDSKDAGSREIGSKDTDENTKDSEPKRDDENL